MTGDRNRRVLVVDVGTSGLRAAVVRGDGTVGHVHHTELLPETPMPNFVQFDAGRMAHAALEVAHAALEEAGGPGSVEAVGIANQRASTIVWDRTTGEPVGPGVGWQDLRTAGMCLTLREQGIRLAPNTSATKLAFLLDMADPGRERDLAFGTVDTWVAWTLSGGTTHVIDATNAGMTELVDHNGEGWDLAVLDALHIPQRVLPRIVDSSGVVGEARGLPGAPPIAGIAGDQQASLVGQGCTRPGLAKVTFGTGGMLDVVVGPDRPGFETRGGQGTVPVIAWRRHGRTTWGLEAVMLSAGTAVEWLRDDLRLIDSAADSEDVAGTVATSGDVFFVPALLGLGTPHWDFGARGTLVGLTRGTGRAEVVRAVLEGVAHRGADLVEAAEADAHRPIASLRVDGGMSANRVFLQALADAAQRPVEVSPVREATTLGAAYLAGLATGVWGDEDEIADAWTPATVIEPRRPQHAARADRDRWRAAVARAAGWVPELSSLDF